ncbi:hypothetical protein ACI2K4_20690 [Micromonospora sp. NPDC050397]
MLLDFMCDLPGGAIGAVTDSAVELLIDFLRPLPTFLFEDA